MRVEAANANELLELIQTNEAAHIAYMGATLSTNETDKLLISLKSNTVLTKLELDYHSVDEKVADQINQILTRNSRICDFEKNLPMPARLTATTLQPHLTFIQELVAISIVPATIRSLQNALLIKVREWLVLNETIQKSAVAQAGDLVLRQVPQANALSLRTVLQEYVLPSLLVNEDDKITWSRLRNYEQSSEATLAKFVGLRYNIEKPTLTAKQFLLLQCLLVTKALTSVTTEKIPLVTVDSPELHEYLDKNENNLFQDFLNCTLTENQPDWLNQLTWSLQHKCRTLLALKNSLFNDESSLFINIVDKEYRTTSLDENVLEVLVDGLRQTTTLEKLNLVAAYPSHSDLTAILRAIADNKTLQLLDLSCNNVGCDETKAIVEMLTKNTSLTALRLSSNKFSDYDVETIAKILAHNTKLKILALDDNNIGIDGATALANALAQNTTLTTVNLKFNKINTVSEDAFVDVLENNTTLTELNLDENSIDNETLDRLEELLARNRRIRDFAGTLHDVVYKEDNNPREIDLQQYLDYIQELALSSIPPVVICSLQHVLLVNVRELILSDQVLQTNEELSTKSFPSSQMAQAEFLSLSEALQRYILPCLLLIKNNDISWARLQGYEQSSEAILAEFVGLRYNPEKPILTARQFFLLQCLLVTKAIVATDVGIAPIVTAARPELQSYLDTNADNIIKFLRDSTLLASASDWLTQLAKSLQAKCDLLIALKNSLLNNKYVRFIDFFNAQTSTVTIDEAVRDVVIDALKETKVLQELDLHGIKLDNVFFVNFMLAIADNKTLQLLDLGQNHLTFVEAQAIANMLEKNTSLTKLLIAHNEVGPSGAKVIANILTANTTLTTLDISHNKINNEGAQTLAKALKNNTTLTEINLDGNNIDKAVLNEIGELLNRNFNSLSSRNFSTSLHAATSEVSDKERMGIHLQFCLNIIQTCKAKVASYKMASELQDSFLKTIFMLVSNGTLSINEVLKKYILLCLLDNKNQIFFSCLQNYENATAPRLGELIGLIGLSYHPGKINLTAKQLFLLQCLLISKAIAESGVATKTTSTDNRQELQEYLNENEDNILQDFNNIELTENSPDWLWQLKESLQCKCDTLLKLKASLLNDGEMKLIDFVKERFYPDRLDKVVMEMLVDGLDKTTKLNKLDLHNFTLNPDDFLIILKAITDSKTIASLDLSNCSINLLKAQHIVDMLSDNMTLESLNLSCNDIGPITAEKISKLLIKNTKLKKLNLMLNYVSTNGVKSIALALVQNTSLIELDLSCNDIDTNGAIAIADVLTLDIILTTLDLRDNRIDNEGGQAFVKVLAANTTLTELYLNDINPSILNEIEKLLIRNRNIRDFNGLLRTAVSEDDNVFLTRANLLSCLDIIKALKAENTSEEIITGLQGVFIKNVFELISSGMILPSEALRAYILPCLLDNNNNIDLSCLQRHKKIYEIILTEFAALVGLRHECHEYIEIKLTTMQLFLLQYLLINRAVIESFSEVLPVLTADSPELQEYLNKNENKLFHNLQKWTLTENEPYFLTQVTKSLQHKCAAFISLRRSLINNLTVSFKDIVDEKYYMGSIDKEILEALTDGLEQAIRLTDLSLRFIKLNDNDLMVVLNALINVKTLSSLDLSWNEIDATRIFFISNNLIQNKTLITLNLSNNALDAAGANVIANSLLLKSAVTTLDLSWNYIGNEGAQLLIKALKTNLSLINLKLENNGIAKEFLDKIEQLLDRNRHINHFNKLLGSITMEFFNELARAANLNNCLDILHKLKITNTDPNIIGRLQHDFLVSILDLIYLNKLQMRDALRAYVLPCMLDINNNINWSHSRQYREMLECQLTNFVGLSRSIGQSKLTNMQKFLLQCLLIINATIGPTTDSIAHVNLNNEELALYLDANECSILKRLASYKGENSNLEWIHLKTIIQTLQNKCSIFLKLITCLYNDEQIVFTDIVEEHYCKEEIDETLLEVLTDGLRKTTTLKHLDLSAIKLNQDDLTLILSAISDNKTLCSLDLSHNNIYTEGMQLIVDKLSDNISLFSLDLSFNLIDLIVIEPVISSLNQNTTLDTLVLTGNVLGVIGANAIAHLLTQNTSLRSLELNWNDIGNEGVIYLADALVQNATLTLLNLSHNQIDNQGAQFLVEMLITNTTLIELNLDDNNIDKTILDEINQLLARNRLIHNFNKLLHTTLSENTDISTIKTNLQSCLNFIRSIKTDSGLSETISRLQHSFLIHILKLIANNIQAKEALRIYIFPYLSDNRQVFYLPRFEAIERAYKQEYAQTAEAILAELAAGVSLCSPHTVRLTIRQLFLLKCLLITKTIIGADIETISILFADSRELQAYLDKNENTILQNLQTCPSAKTGLDWQKQLTPLLRHKCSTLLSLKNSLLNDEKTVFFDIVAEQYRNRNGMIDKVILEVLVNGLRETTKLKSLDLKNISLNKDDLLIILRAIPANRTLKKLHLSHSSIDSIKMRSVANALTKNTRLTSLYLQNNEMDPKTSEIIVELLTKNTTLKELYLSGNRIGFKGADLIATALTQNISLTTLNLMHNHISTEGSIAIANALIQNTTLTTLNLIHNETNNEVAKAFVNALTTNTTLIELYLDYNDIDINILHRIENLLLRNVRIFHFNTLLQAAISENYQEITIKTHLLPCLYNLQKLKADTTSQTILEELQKVFLKNVLELTLKDRLQTNEALREYILPCLFLEKDGALTWPRFKNCENFLSTFAGLHYSDNNNMTDKQFWLLQCFLISKVLLDSNEVLSKESNKIQNAEEFLDKNSEVILKNLNFLVEREKKNNNIKLEKYVKLAESLLAQAFSNAKEYNQVLRPQKNSLFGIFSPGVERIAKNQDQPMKRLETK